MKNQATKKLVDILYLFAPVISLGLFYLVWLNASSSNPDFIPSPVDAFQRFLLLLERPVSKLTVFGHIFASLSRVLIAVGSATVFGVLFGILLGWNKTFFDIFSPIFEMLRPIPSIAWVPLITLWFGIGEFPKIMIVFIASLVSIVINTYTGVKMVDPFIIDVGRSFGVEGRSSLFEIIFPSALTAIFAGVRTSIGTGWMSLLAAEMITSKSGLGFLITRGMDSTDTPLIIVGMVLVGAVGAMLSLGLTYLERWLCPWRNEK